MVPVVEDEEGDCWSMTGIAPAHFNELQLLWENEKMLPFFFLIPNCLMLNDLVACV